MATQRLSQLQKQILRWLWVDEQRIRGGTSSSHHELLQALPVDKSNISRSLRTLKHASGSSSSGQQVAKPKRCT